MNAETKIHLDLTITAPENALNDIAKALSDKLDVMSGKKLPDGVYRIDGTDMLYTLTSSVTHHEAPGAVAKLEQVHGHTPWELATPLDAVHLIDYGKYNPAVDTEKHPGIRSEWAWLKDTYKSSSDYAWGVYFHSGAVDYGYRDSRSRALAVCRPVPVSQ
jgi:hypothetical protein